MYLIYLPSFSQAQSNLPDTSEKFINLGYHKLSVSEMGPRDAKFTIVFESGAGGGSKDWTRVRSLLPAALHTIAYNRAGIANSEPGPLPRTIAQEVLELHQVLKISGVSGPVILVGQSMGGLLVRLYAEQYPENIVGILLVDPTHESGIFGSMKYGGMVRLREKATGKPIPKPQLKMKESPGFDSTADYMSEEFQEIYLASGKQHQPFKDRRLIILGAGNRKQPPGVPDEQWNEIKKERDQQLRDLTNLSGNSKFISVPKSGHMIHYDDPEIVAKAIEMIIQSINSNSRL